ncbi:hypothetical protein AVEN_78989-1 [Araneus ventricosus]|uniref:Uncharacterized protein n=1 Tax=Araneus ventricosus TaxID=182803 RepID=A0A4Y2TJV1_ARAVE|nr:hypothetical protein AVEN_78989-1 [Araneus ventricosus]
MKRLIKGYAREKRLRTPALEPTVKSLSHYGKRRNRRLGTTVSRQRLVFDVSLSVGVWSSHREKESEVSLRNFISAPTRHPRELATSIPAAVSNGTPRSPPC